MTAQVPAAHNLHRPAARRVVIASNPASGRGKAHAAAVGVARDLERRGHDARIVHIGRDSLAEALARADLLVIAGGDGTVSRALPVLAARRVALYHVPLGTENLFAREFGMTQRRAAPAVDTWRTSPIDLGILNGRPFALMVGVGFDGEVVRRLDAARNGPISKASYAGPILGTLLTFRAPLLTVLVDGRTLVDGRRGALVVANCRGYGGRLNPAPRASPGDGLLDVVFIPQAGPARVVAGMAAARLRLLQTLGGALRDRGGDIEVRADASAPVQVDGEPFPMDEARPLRLRIAVAPGAARVLLPAE